VSEIVGERATTAAKVLLVDDEEIVREATAAMLTDAGYTVMQAGSAAEALKIARGESEPDIVVADYKMPGMSGIELAEALRATRPSIPILLITGFANLTDADSGGLPRLAKPFERWRSRRASQNCWKAPPRQNRSCVSSWWKMNRPLRWSLSL